MQYNETAIKEMFDLLWKEYMEIRYEHCGLKKYIC